jgi:hypothetical protein
MKNELKNLGNIDLEIKKLFDKIPEDGKTAYIILKTYEKGEGCFLGTQGKPDEQIKNIVTTMMSDDYFKNCVLSAVLHFFYSNPNDGINFLEKLDKEVDTEFNFQSNN